MCLVQRWQDVYYVIDLSSAPSSALGWNVCNSRVGFCAGGSLSTTVFVTASVLGSG